MAQFASRREFLADVGRGMLVASVGAGFAGDLGLVSRAWANQEAQPLQFGTHEALAALMQDTPADQLLPLLTEKLRNGTTLRDLLIGGVLANARCFGGEDYIGFHTLMALGPALQMSRELPTERQALPVFRVLYRNTARIQETGTYDHETLHEVAPLTGSEVTAAQLREAVHQLQTDRAEQIFAGLANQGSDALLNALLPNVADDSEVHRVNLPYRAWELLEIVGPEHAQTMLRQSLRYCLKVEKHHHYGTREMLAKVFDQFHLESNTPGTKHPGNEWLQSFSTTLLTSKPEQCATAAAAALAEGIAPEAIGQACALVSNQILLRDHGRPQKFSNEAKPAGSTHGDSIGLHSCDAINAWRNLARVSNARNSQAAIVLAAYQVGRDHSVPEWGGDALQEWLPRPWMEDLEALRGTDPVQLLAEAEDAIRQNNQYRAMAAVQQIGTQGGDARPVFDLLVKYATSEDGALHAEKFYHTVTDEFATLPSEFRWRQLVALARVTASEYGHPAPGYAQACELLQVS